TRRGGAAGRRRGVPPAVVMVEAAAANVAAVLRDERRVGELHAGVEAGDDDPLAGESGGPHVGRTDLGDVPLDARDRRLRRAGHWRWNGKNRRGDDLLDLRERGERTEGAHVRGDADGVDADEAAEAADPLRAPLGGEEVGER